MSKKKFTGSVNGKGYYIALVLCAVAIGIAGFLYYRNTDKPNKTADGNTIVNPDDAPVIATNPDGTPATIPNQEEKKPLKTVSPLEGQTVAVYAMDSLTYNPTTRDWRVHNGVDIAADEGTAVVSAADGTVYTVYEDENLLLVERWTDADALAKHAAAPCMAKVRELKEKYATDTKLEKYTILG